MADFAIETLINAHGIREGVVVTVEGDVVIAVSPLVGGKALKGPADRILDSLGIGSGTAGILEAYSGILSTLIVDDSDAADVALTTEATVVVAANTRMQTKEDGMRFGTWLLDTMAP